MTLSFPPLIKKRKQIKSHRRRYKKIIYFRNRPGRYDKRRDQQKYHQHNQGTEAGGLQYMQVFQHIFRLKINIILLSKPILFFYHLHCAHPSAPFPEPYSSVYHNAAPPSNHKKVKKFCFLYTNSSHPILFLWNVVFSSVSLITLILYQTNSISLSWIYV